MREGLSEQTGLIHWRCEAAGHQQGLEGRTADTLTVHDGRWAYCPMDVTANGHDWNETGGVRIEMLRRGSPIIDLDLDVRPRVGPKSASSAAGPPSRGAGNGAAPRKRTTKR